MDMQNKIKKYASIIKASYDRQIIEYNNRTINEMELKLPIKTIDNVKVTVKFRFHTSLCNLLISLYDIYENDAIDDHYIHDKSFNIGTDDYWAEKASKYIFLTLPKLKLSVNGQLKPEEEVKDELEQYELLTGLENVTLDYEECCVCNNVTGCKTHCDHSICYRCMTHIKNVKINEDGDEHIEKPCPLCRKDIQILNL